MYRRINSDSDVVNATRNPNHNSARYFWLVSKIDSQTVLLFLKSTDEGLNNQALSLSTGIEMFVFTLNEDGYRFV